MLKSPEVQKILDDLGWGDMFLAKTSNYETDTYYRVEGTNLSYSGVGEGLYVGRDKDALKAFYDMEGEGLKVTKYIGQPKWMELMDFDEYKKVESKAISLYGQDERSKSSHMKKYAQAMGFDGIRYYDAMTTGEEFVLFNTDQLNKVKQKLT